MYYSLSYNAPHPPPRPRPRRKKYFHRKNQQSLTSTEQYINGDILRRDVIHCINHIFNCMVGLHDLSEIMIERIFISTYIKIICYLRSAAHAVRDETNYSSTLSTSALTGLEMRV